MSMASAQCKKKRPRHWSRLCSHWLTEALNSYLRCPRTLTMTTLLGKTILATTVTGTHGERRTRQLTMCNMSTTASTRGLVEQPMRTPMALMGVGIPALNLATKMEVAIAVWKGNSAITRAAAIQCKGPRNENLEWLCRVFTFHSSNTHQG